MDIKRAQTRAHIQELKDTFNGTNWLDESYQKKLKDVNDDNAFTRPIPQIHSVAELVGHLVIWRNESLKKLTGGSSTLVTESPESWRDNDELRKEGWSKLKNDLFETQEELVDLLSQHPDSYWIENQYRPGFTYQFLIEGLIHHDIYHLGQIGITVKLLSLHT